MTEVDEGLPPGGKASNCECTTVGHPIDVSTGKVLTVVRDISFANPFPIGLYHTWSSDWPCRKEVFGLV